MTRTLPTLVGLGLLAAAARADDDPTHRFPSRAAHTQERAGCPQQVSRLAIPVPTPHDAPGWVGGGRLAVFPRKPDGRAATDGTWGLDYVGFGHRPGRVFLDWWHDRPCQPAPGPYSPDGPHVPDPIGAHPLQKLLGGK